MQPLKKAKTLNKITISESGMAFLEVLIALALLGIIAVAFLSGLATGARATVIADKQTTAESLARSQIEWVKEASYVDEASDYTPAPVPADEDYTGYSVTITAEPLNSPDDGIQKITVTVNHYDKELVQLESYKVDR